MSNLDAIDRDRISVLTGAIVLALALTRFLSGPIRTVELSVFGSPLGVNLTLPAIGLWVIFGMAISAVESLVRNHPMARNGSLSRTYQFWIIPGLLVVALGGLLAELDDVGLWTAGILASAILVPIALVIEYQLVDPDKDNRPFLAMVVLILIHLIAAVLFIGIYSFGVRSLLSGSAALIVTTLLVTRLFWLQVDRPAHAIIYGSTVGIFIGLMTWTLNYWPLSALQGGLVLLLMFYLLVGLTQQYLRGTFSRQVVIEYLTVSTIGSILIVVVAG